MNSFFLSSRALMSIKKDFSTKTGSSIKFEQEQSNQWYEKTCVVKKFLNNWDQSSLWKDLIKWEKEFLMRTPSVNLEKSNSGR